MAHGSPKGGRVSNTVLESQPWRIREIVPDFTLEDVWALPVEGGADEFPALLELIASLDPAGSDSRATRALWRLRDRLGAWFGIGRTTIPADGVPDAPVGDLPIPGSTDRSLTERLPQDLRGTAPDGSVGPSLFSPLYRTDVEAAAEISNRTVHGVLHLAWVERGGGRYQGQMAVFVKPRGGLGRGYMELIKPFRHWIVYPALMRQIERAWQEPPRR